MFLGLRASNGIGALGDKTFSFGLNTVGGLGGG